jgi:hypothetical protein
MVLDTISRGMKIPRQFAYSGNAVCLEVELIVNDLNAQKLITMDVKRCSFDNKKTELHISKTGKRMLNTKKQELSSKSKHLQQLYDTGERG